MLSILILYTVFILTVLSDFVKGEWIRIILLSFIIPEWPPVQNLAKLSIKHPLCGGETQ